MPLRLLFSALLVAVVAVVLPAGAGSTTVATEPSTLAPATMPRGQSPAVPRVLGTTILDGATRIPVEAREVHLLGRSGDEYVVVTWQHEGGANLERIAADGSRRTVLERPRGDAVLSRDGSRIFESVVRARGLTIVTVRDAVTGVREARRRFRGYVRVLDADERRAVLGASAPDRTLWWNPRTDRTRRIAKREGYFADLRAGRLATFTGNPYDGGCSVLSDLSRPRAVLWRSCRRAVLTASPNGRTVLTQHILADGPMARYTLHRQHGRRLAVYRTPGWFGPTAWEDNRSVLILTHGRKKTAIVRCRQSLCERASERIATR